jgi:tetratricopeptide (TPR) repeat protein
LPRSSRKALINWGVALSSSNKPEDALPKFQQALSREPNNAAALYNLGGAYQRLGQHAEAIEQYDRTVGLNQALFTPALQRYMNPVIRAVRCSTHET